MTAVVQAMLELAPRLAEPPPFDWGRALDSDDRGERLAAYAYLHQQPTCDAAVPLVETMTEREDKPFGEYWALKALRQVLGRCGPDPRRTVEPTLRDHLRTLRPGMDRHRELQGLLDSL
jgi:hypothetical protein